jgi:rare lipoprotein A
MARFQPSARLLAALMLSAAFAGQAMAQGAPIEFGRKANGQGVQMAAYRASPAPVKAQPAVETNAERPRLTYRYPDQPDLEYGYADGPRKIGQNGQAVAAATVGKAGEPIDLRGMLPPAKRSADVEVMLEQPMGAPKAFDAAAEARRVAALEDTRAPAPLQRVSFQRKVTAPDVAPEAAPQPTPQRPEWLEQERVGAPYQAEGRWYAPTPEPGYSETGKASFYDDKFHGRRTASGEAFDQNSLTAAHPTLPIPSLVQVTNLTNGREVILRVNDRGPFVQGRILDVSRKAAEVLGMVEAGGAQVHVRYLGPAPKRLAQAPVPTAPEVSAQPLSAPVDLSAPPQPAPRRPVLPVATGKGAYVVQVGAFAAVDNAQRVRDQVRAAGPVMLDPVARPNGQVYRVRIGPFAGRDQAEAARAEAAQMGFGGAVVASLN